MWWCQIIDFLAQPRNGLLGVPIRVIYLLVDFIYLYFIGNCVK